MVEPSTAEPGTPRWWLDRLNSELVDRTPDMTLYRNLVDDVHDPIQSSETSSKFQRMAGLATFNLCGLAIEASAERMSIEGVRVGDEPDADKDIWDKIWLPSGFDAGSQEAITDALIYSRSFISVSPPVDGVAKLNYEDPRQVVVAYSPDGATRVAALKVFTDEWTGSTFGTLYLPNVVAKMVRKDPPNGSGMPYLWGVRELRRDDPVVRNPFGEVPFFECRNRPLGTTRSEIANIVTPQKLLNQTVFNVEAIADYGAFRQKWATGLEVPRDPDTGKPVAPFNAHIANLFVSEDTETKFGDFNATELAPHIEFAREISAHIARLQRVPITYFLNNVSNIGPEALSLLVSGLVLKCGRRVKGYNPGFEGAISLSLRAVGDKRGDENIQIKWADMETRSRAQDADAAVKLTQGTNPVITPQTAQEKYLGMSQTERDRDDAWRAEGSATSALNDLLSAANAAPVPPPAAPVAPVVTG